MEVTTCCIKKLHRPTYLTSAGFEHSMSRGLLMTMSMNIYIYMYIYSCQRDAEQGGTPPQSYFHQHFLREGHHSLLNGCEIIIIDKTDASDPTRREFFWMRLLKTIYPLGLNVEDGL